MRPVLFATFISAATAAVSGSGYAQQAGGGWVGARVVTLIGATIRPVDGALGDRATSGAPARPGKEQRDFHVYRVESAEGPWLLIVAEKESVRGWVEASLVLPLDQAIGYYSSRIAADPTNPASYSQRGLILAETGELDLALADDDEAIRLDPTREVVYLNRGVVHCRRKDYIRAMVDFDKAIELDPDYARSYLDRGMLWAGKHDHDRAIADFDRAIRLDPKSSWASNNRGVSRQEKKEYDRALADYDRAIRLDPRNALAYLNRSSVRRALGDYDAALADIGRAIRLDPRDPRGYNARSWLQATCPEARYRHGKGAVDDAIRAAGLRTEKDASDLAALAAAYAERCDYARAIETQARAQLLYKQEIDLKDGRVRLELYKAGKPFREAVRDGFASDDRMPRVNPRRADHRSLGN